MVLVTSSFRVENPDVSGPGKRKMPSSAVSLEVAPLIGPGDRSGSESNDDDIRSAEEEDYSRTGVLDIVKSRGGWLCIFCIGLLLSAFVVQRFSDLLEHHVQLSFFVPLVMGHGGNTGSQAVSTVIRALALRQIPRKETGRVLWKETLAGGLMGAAIGLVVLAFSFVWPHLSPQVGLVVAVALPVISLWSNLLGALLTIMAERVKLDPAVTSVPLMTTIVDATGLVIYFFIAELVMDDALDNAIKSAHKAVVHTMTSKGL